MSASPKTDEFSKGDFRNFKPMYTLQPVKATRDKQLKQWSSIVMSFCKTKDLQKINPADFPPFSNSDIDRKLSTEAIKAVIDSMIAKGDHSFYGNFQNIYSDLKLWSA